MKKLVIAVFLLFASIACIETLSAQAFPINVHVEWSPNDPVEEVTHYLVSFGDASESVPNNCVNTICRSRDFTLTAQGNYTATVVAVNQWGNSAATAVTIRVSVPGNSRNVRITTTK